MLEASLPTFDAHAAWVLHPDATPVHGIVRELDESLRRFPLPRDELAARLNRDKFAHFFLTIPAGRLEVRAAPIQPSSDNARVTPPQGWLLTGRLWNEAHLASLRATLGGRLDLLPADARRPEVSATGIYLHRELPGWDGTAPAALHYTYESAPLTLLQAENKEEFVLFAGFGLAAIVMVLFGLARFVILPLGRLEESLGGGTATPLAPLLRDPGEFGRLARLVETSFAHQAALQSEIEERRRVEEALRRSEEAVRRSAELKTRLARDLHDGVIQSLFAAGLGVEVAADSIRADPEAAERRLKAAMASLNRTIREVRSFITGLEPEERDRLPFAFTLQALIDTLCALHPGRIELMLQRDAAPLLSSAEELHALQIVREGISNSIRHGGAGSIQVKVETDGAKRILSITDDGRGFDPVEASARLGGLSNMAARAREIGATFSVDTAPGRSTRLTLVLAANGAT